MRRSPPLLRLLVLSMMLSVGCTKGPGDACSKAAHCDHKAGLFCHGEVCVDGSESLAGAAETWAVLKAYCDERIGPNSSSISQVRHEKTGRIWRDAVRTDPVIGGATLHARDYEIRRMKKSGDSREQIREFKAVGLHKLNYCSLSIYPPLSGRMTTVLP